MDERDALIAALQQQIAEQQRQIAEKDRQIAELTEENSSLASQLEKQKEEISELKQKLGLNSHNSRMRKLSIFRRNAENVLFLKSAGRTAKCSDAESAGMRSTLCCT